MRACGSPIRGIENYGGSFRFLKALIHRQVDVHLVAADVDQLAGHGMSAAVASGIRGLIDTSGNGEQ